MIRSKQKTVAREVVFTGIGVHSGACARVIVKPNVDKTGIVFHHKDYPGDEIVIGKVIPELAMHATVVKARSWYLSTIEHLMAAFHMLGIAQAHVYVDAFEIPILDGSALGFVQGFLDVGLSSCEEDLSFLTPRQTLSFADEQGRSIEIAPFDQASLGGEAAMLHISYVADFSNPLLGRSYFEGGLTACTFIDHIAPARTFGFLEQLPMLRSHGLARGASLGNTVVLSNEEFLNDRRFEDECVRHKVLDFLGDVALLGYPLAGSVCAVKTGHSFNRRVVEHFLTTPDQWVLF